MSNERRGVRRIPRAAGVTLVELIVAMVIIGLALGGLIAVFNSSNRASVDPLVLQQKAAIAESLMGEILLKPYTVDTTAITPNVRDSYNDVQDFKGYGNGLAGIRDVDNNPVPGLQSYSVTVDVAPVTLSSGVPALKITIAVSYAADRSSQDAFVLTGWRTQPS